jgi:hypothetical protein
VKVVCGKVHCHNVKSTIWLKGQYSKTKVLPQNSQNIQGRSNKSVLNKLYSFNPTVSD